MTDEEEKQLRKVGKRIQILRKEAGLTQEKLSFDTGLEQSYLSNVETGQRNVSVLNIIKIAKAIGVEPYECLKLI